jgi:hypothetical protein
MVLGFTGMAASKGLVMGNWAELMVRLIVFGYWAIFLKIRISKS